MCEKIKINKHKNAIAERTRQIPTIHTQDRYLTIYTSVCNMNVGVTFKERLFFANHHLATISAEPSLIDCYINI